MDVNEFELMAALPKDRQYEILFCLIPSFDVCYDIEYFYDSKEGETSSYRASLDSSGSIGPGWPFMAIALTGRYGLGITEVDHLSDMVNLMKEGKLRRGDTRMWVDVHKLLTWETQHLSRVKKMVGVTLALGLVDKIEYNIWGEDSNFDRYDMVPQQLFNEHFGRDTKTNPHGVRIEFDLSCKPETVEELARVQAWDYPANYDLDTERENQSMEWLYGQTKLPDRRRYNLYVPETQQEDIEPTDDGPNWTEGYSSGNDDGWSNFEGTSGWDTLPML